VNEHLTHRAACALYCRQPRATLAWLLFHSAKRKNFNFDQDHSCRLAQRFRLMGPELAYVIATAHARSIGQVIAPTICLAYRQAASTLL